MNALPSPPPSPQFRVFTGEQVDAAIRAGMPDILAAVEAAYRAHHAGRTVIPQSQFLRFPDERSNRIIALPAHIRNGEGDGKGEPQERVRGGGLHRPDCRQGEGLPR